MSSATRDGLAVAQSHSLSGERLAELLSVISEANEFSAAAAFLAAQFADVASASRGCVLTIDPHQQQLELVSSVGFAPDEKPTISIPLADDRHPLVAATLCLCAVSCGSSDSVASGIPFDSWIAVPFPQPQFKGAVDFIPDDKLESLELKSCSVHLADPRERRRRAGHAPCGVVIVEAQPDDELITQLFHAASLAGPVLSRVFAVEEYRRSAERLDQQRDRLDLILENVADPILVTDDRSKIILMNRQAEALFSLDATDDKASAGTRRERAQSVRANDTKFTAFISDFTIHPEASRREEMSLTVPGSGVELPVEVVSGKIFNARGEPMAIVSVLHDLTEQAENDRLYRELKTFSSQLEDRIRAATSDLAAQNARLQWQSQELEKANRAKSEFLASMSHELRTPINALIGYTALILDEIYGKVNDRQVEALQRIHASAQHLLVLINDILDLAKIEAGRMPLHLEDVDLRHILLEVTSQMEPLFRRKGLEFSWGMTPDSVPMRTDRTKVKQIMLNLLSNAVKFTYRGSVAVEAEVANGVVSISVADTGIGIAEEHLAAIWEDFRQVDQSSTREFGGTGLGLSITKKLVEALGGHADLRSSLGDGSTFTITLPRASKVGPDDESLLTTGESVVFVGTAEGPTRPISGT